MTFCILKPNHELKKTYPNLPKNPRIDLFWKKPYNPKSKTNLHIEKP